MRALTCVLLFATASCSPVLAASAVSLDAAPCFAGMASGGVFPVVVTVRNAGPSADADLQVSTSGFGESPRVTHYPLNLPTGTVKRVITYPRANRFGGQLTVTLSGGFRGGSVATPVDVKYGDGRQIGMISDGSGGLSILHLSHAVSMPGPNGQPFDMQQAGSYIDSYARPEDAPDRAPGYDSLYALVIGDGAERLQPPQWAAIRNWTLSGGSLILLGGAGAAYLRAPDVQPLLPVNNIHGAALASLPGINGTALPPGPAAISTGALNKGAVLLAGSGSMPVLASRPFGAGTVLFVALSPFDKPLRGWSGQKALWTALVQDAAPPIASDALMAGLFGRENIGAAFDPASDAGESDPFRVQLPPVSTVAWIFLAYFVVVVPINYAVLRAMRRLEWAWISSPVISVAFACVFFVFTAHLYRAGQSRRNRGIILAAAGDRDARFVGYSEVFFPRSGSYDIIVPDAESLDASGPADDMPSFSPGGTTSMETVDTGTVGAPGMSIGNLAFRRFWHTEPVALNGTLEASVDATAGGKISGSIHNDTGYDLRTAFIVVPGANAYAFLGDLRAGASRSITDSRKFQIAPQRRVFNPRYRRFDLTPRRADGQELTRDAPIARLLLRHRHAAAGAYLIARTRAESLGPPLGEYVGGNDGVTLFASLPLEAAR